MSLLFHGYFHANIIVDYFMNISCFNAVKNIRFLPFITSAKLENRQNVVIKRTNRTLWLIF